MKNLYDCRLMFCENPDIKIDSRLNKTKRYIKAVPSYSSNALNIICIRNTPYIIPFAYNYATEVLTGVKIPLIGENNGSMIGRLDKPYYAEIGCCYLYCFQPFRTSRLEISSSNNFRKYIDEHIDEDGTFSTFKKQLEEIITTSIETYNQIEIVKHTRPETAMDVYRESIRTRSR